MGFCPEMFEYILTHHILTLSVLIVNSGVLVQRLEIFIREIALATTHLLVVFARLTTNFLNK